MLMPKRTKFRKLQRGRMKGKASRGNSVHFGEFGLSAMECGIVTDRQIEAVRVTVSRKMKRSGKIYIRIFPAIPYTKKPAETRMGKGKGSPEGWICKIKPGKVMIEVAGVPEEVAREALVMASYKLSIKTKVFQRREI